MPPATCIAAPTAHTVPFPHLRTARALSAQDLARLDQIFEATTDWARHDFFYRAHMADIEDRVPADLRRRVATRLKALTGLPLAGTATVTAQRMAPGDGASVHTDCPQLGFEVVRLIVQLDGTGDPSDGGVFVAHPDADGRHTSWTQAPVRNSGIAFVMRPTTHHSVTDTHVPRRTVVFHVQHRGNDASVEAFVRAALSDMRFDTLPAALKPAMDAAEVQHDADDTYRAARVAWVLAAWGRAPSDVADGYAAGLLATPPIDATWSVSLAHWVVCLHDTVFDVDVWQALADRKPPDPADPAYAAWQELVAPRSGKRKDRPY